MNDVTIKFNKITQNNETWPPEGETVMLSNGDCIIRVDNQARGIGFICNDFISSYIGVSWGNIPKYLKPKNPALFPIDDEYLQNKDVTDAK